MSRSKLRLVVFLSIAAAAASSASAESARTAAPPSRDLVRIDASEVPELIAYDVPVTWKGASFVLAEWDAAEQQLARERGIDFEVLLPRIAADQELILFEMDEGEQAPLAWAPHTLHSRGLKTVLAIDRASAERWIEAGFHAVPIGREPRGWGDIEPRAVNCNSDPLVGTLLGRMDSARWMDWIEKISGIEPVEVAGVSAPITSRHSSRLFTGHAHARGFDFLQQQTASWHYGPGPATVELDSYTPTGSIAEGATWKNLVLTIPGQTLPGSEVLITAHFDSRAISSPGQQSTAPGADDNGTGSALLFEAARLLRQFRFQRTIRLIWFTGEEQGLFGSAAWVNDHALGGILGVVNMDMAGYDGNGDRCFEIHVGTLPQSDSVGQCMASATTAYSPTLHFDYLTSNATDRSDHASFWNASTPVGAIEVAENFFSDSSPGGCVGVDTNPNYHTPTDTISAVSASYGFDIARAALATAASLAGPLSACFADAPVLGANPGASVVDLSWAAVAGASSYRVYRSKGGCQGQWSEVGTTGGTSWSDTGAADPLTYSYHVEAVAADGFCVSRASNCVSAQPTVFRARATGLTSQDVCPAGGTGSGNGVVDPGETVTVPVTLQNDGNMSLTSIAGVLSSDAPGVAATDAAASWPDLAPTQSALSLPDHFTIRLDPAAACGPAVDLDLALGYTQGGNDTGLSLYTGATSPELLLAESFSAGVPPGWSVLDGGAGGGAAATWTTANPGGRSIGAPFFAGPFAIVDSSAAGVNGTQDEQLVTPSVDVTGCRQVTLSFANQFRYDTGTPYEHGDVEISTDGGASWLPALQLFAESNGYTSPVPRTLDITALVAADPADVRARFRYHHGQNDFWWAIDDVRITCARPACIPCAAPAAPPGAVDGLVVSRQFGQLVLDWSASAASCGAVEYAVYRGDLGLLATSGYSHDTQLVCEQAAASFSIAESDARLGTADYFLVVAANGSEEGSYGRDGSGAERPAAAPACQPVQNLATCAP